MSLLLDTSLVVTPTVYNAGTLFGIVPTDPSSNNADITVTRATTKTRTNSAGLIETVAINTPSIDYSLGGCPNILFEPQRTNLFVRSEEFDTSWTPIQGSVTANATTSPSGSMDADRFTGNGAAANHRLSQPITLTSGSTYTMSCYVKKDTNNFFQFYFLANQFGSLAYANFDVNNGVLGTVGSAAIATITGSGDGWYRCSMTATCISSSSNINMNLSLITSATSIRNESLAIDTSVFLWGAQVEIGAYPTSYIPTVAATVTRNVDVITRNNVFTNGLITAAGGTWFIELRNNIALTRDGSANSVIFLGDSSTPTTGNCFRIWSGTSSRFIVQKVVASTPTQLFVTTANTCKLAIKWNGTTADIFENGVKVVSATAFTATSLENLFGGGAQTTAFINEMALFKTPLSDTRCIALTTL